MEEELRKHRRAKTEYRVEYGPFPPGVSQGPSGQGTVVNLGGGGLMFLTGEPIPEGSQCILRFHLPGWRLDGDELVEDPADPVGVPIAAIAEIIRCRAHDEPGRYEIGVQFRGRVL